jgi:hypothetical protein
VLRPGQPDLPSYQHTEGRDPNYQAGGSSCQPSVLSTIRDSREAARERERCAKETEDHALQSNDLIQQARAADASQAQAWLAYQMAWMGVYGTIGGFLTLLAAAAAAFYARDGARAGKDSLAHARPWVSIKVVAKRVWLSTAGYSFDYDVICHNHGETIARNFELKCWLDFQSKGGPDIKGSWWAKWEPPAIATAAVVMPGEDVVFARTANREKNVIPWEKNAEGDRMMPIVVASVFYRADQDEEWHRTDRAFTIGTGGQMQEGFIRANVDDLGPECLIVHAFGGNRAT